MFPWQRLPPTLNQVIREQRSSDYRMPNFKADTWTGSRSFYSFDVLNRLMNENRKQINVSSKPFDDEKRAFEELNKKSKPPPKPLPKAPPKKEDKKKPTQSKSSFKSKELARRKYKEKNFINR